MPVETEKVHLEWRQGKNRCSEGPSKTTDSVRVALRINDEQSLRLRWTSLFWVSSLRNVSAFCAKPVGMTAFIAELKEACVGGGWAGSVS